jgi:hypothetical protein
MGKLDGLDPAKEVRPCKVTRTLEELEAADAEILREALEDPRWTARSLAIALSLRGVLLSRDTLTLHIKGACSCLKA